MKKRTVRQLRHERAEIVKLLVDLIHKKIPVRKVDYRSNEAMRAKELVINKGFMAIELKKYWTTKGSSSGNSHSYSRYISKYTHADICSIIIKVFGKLVNVKTADAREIDRARYFFKLEED